MATEAMKIRASDVLALRARKPFSFIGVRRLRDFCERCELDDHSKRHSKIGCLEIVGGEPFDFICRCEVRRGRRRNV